VIPSRETLVETERRTGFRAPQLEIVIRLRDLLERIAADRILADSLALKGGTPLNLCFGVPPRLSVDLDFNYIGAADRAVMLTARSNIVAAFERLGRRAGYQVQQSAEDHAGQTFYFRYRSPLGTAARLQIDINFLFRTPIVPVQSRPVWSPLDEAPLETSVVGMGELMAGKMLALVDRSAPRDLFDVARYAVRTGLPALGTRDRLIFIALSGMLNHPLINYTVERVQRVTDAAHASDDALKALVGGRWRARNARSSWFRICCGGVPTSRCTRGADSPIDLTRPRLGRERLGRLEAACREIPRLPRA